MLVNDFCIKCQLPGTLVFTWALLDNSSAVVLCEFSQIIIFESCFLLVLNSHLELLMNCALLRELVALKNCQLFSLNICNSLLLDTTRGQKRPNRLMQHI